MSDTISSDPSVHQQPAHQQNVSGAHGKRTWSTPVVAMESIGSRTASGKLLTPTTETLPTLEPTSGPAS
ncbi:MAG: hypothetical protein WDM81_13690 [Rhizomicrobium sp.]